MGRMATVLQVVIDGTKTGHAELPEDDQEEKSLIHNDAQRMSITNEDAGFDDEE